MLNELLRIRGIDGEAELVEFLSPNPKLAYDPFLLANMHAGVDLLLDAIYSGSKIVIYGDYDCDGVTSTALLMKVIGSLTENVAYYIPSRLDEGYGLNKSAIDQIYQDEGEVIVTVDCGSVSAEEVAYANSLGIETIVTDHHTIKDVVAPGIVINPKAPGDTYPFKGLAGVGVAYKLALALSRNCEIPRSLITEVLELVAVGTIGDVMPLIDENRSLVKYGLRLMRLGFKNKGLRRLTELSGVDYNNITSTNVAFSLVPRINAAGRLGDASLGVRVLLSEDDDEIESLCTKLMETNAKRRELQREAYENCISLADSELKKGDFIMIEAEHAHEGILGIVAGNLKERYNRPVVIVSPNDGQLKGTGRSIEGVDLYALLNRHSDFFVKFGGHKAACGFTMKEEKLDKLRAALNEDVEGLLADNESLFDRTIDADLDIFVPDVSIELAKALELFAPFGAGNPEPVFKFKNAQVLDWKFLSDNKHARFSVMQRGSAVQCILFNKAMDVYERITGNKPLTVYGTMDINRWKDRENVQIRVLDVEEA
ncbi:single-stranded-DNA-specific exonuclease RecJ [Mogibacterium pumilum]|uniref:single-stranded-DNA-specific exonuclease RecJ n=1 Tax=Mogibacterium pumilum TaxID=86332 RepID=UPI001A9A4462|nr:single-stranded-DNA-specific exonuclease RecJ [Mogibacterium pumilum]